MQIKIIKCTKNEMWYNNHIGEVFDVYDSNISSLPYYIMKPHTGDIGFLIGMSDAVPFNREEKIQKILGNLK